MKVIIETIAIVMTMTIFLIIVARLYNNIDSSHTYSRNAEAEEPQ